MGVTRKVLNWYARLSPKRGRSPPPYEHVVQIGDPTLRRISEEVSIDKIKSKEIQGIIKKLQYVLNEYGSFGLSAPQIGVNMRIFAMQVTPKQLADAPKESAFATGMTVVPFTVFVNPKMRVVDFHKVVYTEGCESVRGFAADVVRYRGVEVSGYDSEGEPTTQTFKNWSARIVQHEFDHLDGKLYTDVMDRKSLHCVCWEEVNLSKGKVVIPFSPE